MHTAPVITAGLDPVVLLLLYFFFVVVSVLKKRADKAQGKSGDDGKPAGHPREMNETLREFLESMTGQPMPRVEPREEPPVAPPVVARRKPMPRPPPPEAETEPRITRRRERPPPPSPSPRALQGISPPATVDVTQSEIADAIQEEMPSALGKLSALTQMSAMRMGMPSMRFPNLSDDSATRFHLDLKKHKDVRRAIVERIVLGPPRGMGADFEEHHLSP